MKKKYTTIVETTFSLKSQIVKKSNQLRISFLLFSFIHKLHLAIQNMSKIITNILSENIF